jgi:hypothetical protein
VNLEEEKHLVGEYASRDEVQTADKLVTIMIAESIEQKRD